MIRHRPQLTVVCDNCGTHLEAIAHDPDQARRIGEFKGWGRHFGRDLCATCKRMR